MFFMAFQTDRKKKPIDLPIWDVGTGSRTGYFRSDGFHDIPGGKLYSPQFSLRKI